MQKGNQAEAWIKGFMQKTFGNQIVNLERFYDINRGNLSGRIDIGFALEPDNHRSVVIPIEVKCTNMFDQLETVEDILSNKWCYKWIWQLHGYMLAMDVEIGIMLLIDASSYTYRLIGVPMDWELAERLLSKAELIEQHLAAGTLPDPINDPNTCTDCDLRHVCGPELDFQSSLEFFEKSELDKDMERLKALKAEYKPAIKEIDSLDKKVKASLNTLCEQNPGLDKLSLGDMLVKVSTVNVKARTQDAYSYKKFSY